ncbi:MAG: hypothetical protein C4532_00060 [Candidatus Abyssobacteria bacterium SURF_17]|jgi:frataxin-like iron-binding protein CyaY|uniref:Uncharacterized protein n=1 Tax=Candidatus Abyssobacteria bacterium SURF_17 TaxID=2093361 RepID=A0A419F9U4_9BACT|nr:MAG: hypothetical protein C4532_00060 [Candidatus Abyssubacteria bacterium SURF_17]
MMKIKSITTLFFLVACTVFIYLIFSDGDHQAISAEQSVQSKPLGDPSLAEDEAISQGKSASEQVIAYYFHGNRRCRTCLTIEAYTEEALKEKFGDSLKSGELIWRSVDVSIPDNKHFVKDYQLYAQSVVLSAVQGGKQVRWKNLDKVWQMVRNKEAFLSYIQTETAAFLEENKS